MHSQIKQAVKKTPILDVYRAFQRLLAYKDILRYKSPDAEGYFCIGCGNHWKKFKPMPKAWVDILRENGWKFKLDDAETLNYQNYTCYGCGMTDRDRLYALYLSDIIKERESVSIIEFAPTPALSNYLKSFKGVTHRTSDLYAPDVDDTLDIQDLHKYDDQSFDIFICSHILEHVDDDIKAMRELFRITRSGGVGVAMVPIFDGVMTTHEDETIKDEGLRVRYFGQADHVRQYSKEDFIARLKGVGFDVKLFDVNHFGHEVFEKNGITPKSVLYIVNK